MRMLKQIKIGANFYLLPIWTMAAAVVTSAGIFLYYVGKICKEYHDTRDISGTTLKQVLITAFVALIISTTLIVLVKLLDNKIKEFSNDTVILIDKTAQKIHICSAKELKLQRGGSEVDVLTNKLEIFFQFTREGKSERVTYNIEDEETRRKVTVCYQQTKYNQHREIDVQFKIGETAIPAKNITLITVENKQNVQYEISESGKELVKKSLISFQENQKRNSRYSTSNNLFHIHSNNDLLFIYLLFNIFLELWW